MVAAAAAGVLGRGEIESVVAGGAAVEAAGLVVVLVEGVEISGWWRGGASGTLVGLLLVLAIDLSGSNRG